MGKKRDSSDFECDMVVGAGLSISESADLLVFSHAIISRVSRECLKKTENPVSGSCFHKNVWLMSEVRREWADWLDDRNATVTKVATLHNQGMQNTIYEHTTHGTLEQMGFSSRRPHQVPLLLVKKRKQRLEFAQAHQNWKIEDWKNVAWWASSWFQLWHSDGKVRFWQKQHESMDPSCLVSMVQTAAGCVIVWEIYSWHTLGPLIPTEHHLNTTAYLNIVTEHVHPCKPQCTIPLMTTFSRIIILQT